MKVNQHLSQGGLSTGVSRMAKRKKSFSGIIPNILDGLIKIRSSKS